MSATFMTPFFFLDPSSQGTGMTREETWNNEKVLHLNSAMFIRL
ncbi:hypothetical protein [Wolbachia endosymbiont (group A) of Scambus nigricans]|nr:hypothetical protein [Wolbachia endosymbiont (group A) of Scambus nigricans]